MIRLIKLAKELNRSFESIINEADALGYHIINNPTTRISDNLANKLRVDKIYKSITIKIPNQKQAVQWFGNMKFNKNRPDSYSFIRHMTYKDNADCIVCENISEVDYRYLLEDLKRDSLFIG